MRNNYPREHTRTLATNSVQLPSRVAASGLLLFGAAQRRLTRLPLPHHVSLPEASRLGGVAAPVSCDYIRAVSPHHNREQWKASSTSLSSSGTSVLSTRNSTPSVRGLIRKWRRWKKKCLASEMNWWIGSHPSSNALCLLLGNGLCLHVLFWSSINLMSSTVEMTCLT